MRKFGLALAGLALLLTMLSAPACADYFATIDGRTSDRVHLREGPSANTASLGLYFNGTAVTCLSERNGTWMRVRIGSQTGYMMSRYLSERMPVNRQPTGYVTHVGRNSSVHLRATPGGTVVTSLPYGSELTVLGETHDGWYYVIDGWGDEGYMSAAYVRVED